MFSDQDFRKLFEDAPIGLAVCQMDGMLELVNQAFADILGRTIEETLAIDYWMITPKGYEAAEAIQLEEIKIRNRYGPYEKHFLSKDGRLVPVRLNGCLVSIDGVQHIWSSVEKIDSPLHSGALIREAPVGLALCSEDGRLVASNQSFLDIIGYTADELVKLDYWQITPKSYEEEEAEQLKSLKTTGKYGPYYKHYIHKNGHLVPVMLLGKFVRINDEDFIWSVVTEEERPQHIPGETKDDPNEIEVVADPIKNLDDFLISAIDKHRPIRPIPDVGGITPSEDVPNGDSTDESDQSNDVENGD